MTTTASSRHPRRVVLAYSGGLDTVTILTWLIERGWEVVAFIADVGQKEDFAAVAEGARRVGAVEAVVEDLRRELVTEFVFPAVAGNAVYESRYLLGTALARPLIARRQVEVALARGAGAVAHGATGKGNDQVRFELAYAALAPQLEVIAPWKDREFLARFQGRSDLLAFVREHGLTVEATAEKPYSSDENLMHKSYEAGILEDPWSPPPPNVFKLTRSPREAPDEPARLDLWFDDARPVRLVELDGIPETAGEGGEAASWDDPLGLFERLNELGGLHAVGRVDMVENRFVGIKSRGVYETPGGTIPSNASPSATTPSSTPSWSPGTRWPAPPTPRCWRRSASPTPPSATAWSPSSPSSHGRHAPAASPSPATRRTATPRSRTASRAWWGMPAARSTPAAAATTR